MERELELIHLLDGYKCLPALVSDIDLLPTNVIRMSTNYLRVDNSFVDLFITENMPYFNRDRIEISDLGETWGSMSASGIEVPDAVLRHVCDIYGVQLRQRTLFLAADLNSILEAIHNLAQACITVANLSILNQQGQARRSAPRLAAAAMVEMRPSTKTLIVDRLRRKEIPYQENARMDLRGSHSIEVDLLIGSGAQESVAMVVDHTKSKPALKARLEHAFVIHQDLIFYKTRQSRLSILDDSVIDSMRGTESIAPLGRVSEVKSYSELEAMWR